MANEKKARIVRALILAFDELRWTMVKDAYVFKAVKDYMPGEEVTREEIREILNMSVGDALRIHMCSREIEQDGEKRRDRHLDNACGASTTCR